MPRLLGAGYLAFTVDQGEHTERYQGIVELQGATLADCIHHYFRQSEQVEAGLKVAVARLPDADGAPRWRAGCLMIERLPADGSDGARRRGRRLAPRRDPDELVHRRSELLDRNLAPEALLYRLFHEDGVRAYPQRALRARMPLLARAGRDACCAR